VRGGNDAYEAFSTGEVAAMNFAYSHAQPGQTIGMVSPYIPLGFRSIQFVQIYVGAGGGTPSLSDIQSGFLSVLPKWIVLSQSQEAWGEIVAGYSKGWEATLESVLTSHGYQIAAVWSTSTVLRLGT